MLLEVEKQDRMPEKQRLIHAGAGGKYQINGNVTSPVIEGKVSSRSELKEARRVYGGRNIEKHGRHDEQFKRDWKGRDSEKGRFLRELRKADEQLARVNDGRGFIQSVSQI